MYGIEVTRLTTQCDKFDALKVNRVRQTFMLTTSKYFGPVAKASYRTWGTHQGAVNGLTKLLAEWSAIHERSETCYWDHVRQVTVFPAEYEVLDAKVVMIP